MSSLSPLSELWLGWFGSVPKPAQVRNLDKWLKPKIWIDSGWSSPWLWGMVRTKGSLVYRVVLNKASRTSECTCSAREQPCVHAIALLQGWQERTLSVDQEKPLPGWIPQQIVTRLKEELPKPAKPSTWVTESRIKEMEKGYAFLEKWLADLTRMGWKSALETSPDTLEDAAARLVNDRLPGPARLVRQLQPATGMELSVSMIRRSLGRLFLAARGFRNRDQLTQDEWINLLIFSGITIRKDALKKRPAVVDTWQVLHVEETEVEADLRSRHTWMVGIQTGRYALLLDFAWKKAPMPPPLQPGGAWNGSCFFYPGSGQVRVVLGEGRSVAFQAYAYSGHDGWKEALEYLAHCQAEDPLRFEHPASVRGLRLRKTDGEVVLVDRYDQGYPLQVKERMYRDLLVHESQSGIQLFGLFMDGLFLPKSILEGGSVTAL